MSQERKLLETKPVVMNIGLDIFYESLRQQGVEAVHVKWQPPPQLEKEYQDILSKIL